MDTEERERLRKRYDRMTVTGKQKKVLLDNIKEDFNLYGKDTKGNPILKKGTIDLDQHIFTG